MRLFGWLAMRVAVCAATLIALSAVVFWSTELLPGDVVGVVAGQDATDAERAVIRQELGMDRPPAQRYLEWAGGILEGDFGTSLVSGREVGAIVLDRFGASIAVLLPAATLIFVLAGLLGTTAGLRAGSRLDRALSGTTLGLISTPDFLIATVLLMIFTVWLPVLPAVAIVPIGESLWQHPEVIALPAIALALGGFGSTMRMLRASVVQTATRPFAEFARLNGVRGPRYVWTILTNAAGPAIHAFTVMVAGLLGGAIVVETLFNVPGLGYELTRAVSNRDVPLVQGISLTLGAATLVTLLAGDIAARLVGSKGAEPAGARS